MMSLLLATYLWGQVNRQFILLWVVNIAATLAIELLSVTILVAVFEATDSIIFMQRTFGYTLCPTYARSNSQGK